MQGHQNRHRGQLKKGECDTKDLSCAGSRAQRCGINRMSRMSCACECVRVSMM